MKKDPRTLVIFSAMCCAFTWAALGEGRPDSHPRILVTGLFAEEIEELRQENPRVDLVSVERDQVAQKVADADALIGNCSREAIQAGRKLRWIQVLSAGVDHCRSSELINSDITLTNCKIIMGPQIADHAMALLLGLTRSLREAFTNMSHEEWKYLRKPMVELRGKTALIIGLGGIGTQVAERAAAFGMRVLAVDPKDISFIKSVEMVSKPHMLRSLLPQADVVFMCAPHTPESEGMLGPEEFALMKQGTYFVNVSRGKTVQTEALVQALSEGRLAGAGLDVVDPEPLPEGHPLWKFSNVIITPHSAARSTAFLARRLELVKYNLKSFVEGRPFRNIVNKVKGY